MIELYEWLLDRIREDETIAQLTGGKHDGIVWNAWGGEDEPETMWYRARWDTARILRECEAKRLIVENTKLAHDLAMAEPLSSRLAAFDSPMSAYWRGQDWACRVMALTYRDEPGYRDEWGVPEHDSEPPPAGAKGSSSLSLEGE